MRRLLVLAAALLLLAGCGGGPAVSGRAVFSHSCSGCHTLTGHDTNVDGGDLAVGHFSVAEVESFAAVMPVRPRLTSDELHAVAVYVVSRQTR
ncbi:MAG TPA: cytochrome c [Gaiellaceae bacterium]|nr:cytochrome c [Gaiellaceae bacterium]